MTKLTGNEHFMFDGMPINKLLLDFWSWSSSYLLTDGIRGELAEFLVATAIGTDTNSPRTAWGDYDLLLDNKYRIEVKSSSYLQAWDVYDNVRTPVGSRKGLSKIKFDIKPVRASGFNRSLNYDIQRHSEAYVFCLYACIDKENANPMLLDDWNFFVLPTSKINEMCGEQKTISLSSLKKLSPIECKYDTLGEAVRKAVFMV